jgi:hypothetical protein
MQLYYPPGENNRCPDIPNVRLQLSDTTLIAVDCVDLNRIIPVIDRCKTLCDFADVKLLTNIKTEYKHKVAIQPLTSLVHYSIFCLKELYKYVDTAHLLIVQHDGWILNPRKWNNDWLKYDYMGAIFNQEDVMGAGGFSFRSKALMEAVSKKYPDFDGSEEHAQKLQAGIAYYEDGEIAIHQRKPLEAEGFLFPSLTEAAQFCQGGNPSQHLFRTQPFGFHRPHRKVDIINGSIDPVINLNAEIPVL